MAHEHRHGHDRGSDDSAQFEPAAWEERYSGAGAVWSGSANPRLVEVASALTPGTALDVGCGEGGDVVWLASHRWRTTGADFSENGLARATAHAEEAGVADRTDWWRIDARDFASDGRLFDLVTTHYLHPPENGMVDVVGRLAGAVTSERRSRTSVRDGVPTEIEDAVLLARRTL